MSDLYDLLSVARLINQVGYMEKWGIVILIGVVTSVLLYRGTR
mgnify:CR=1 FL=1